MAQITLQRALLLRAMLEAPAAEWYGLELSRHVGLKTGTVYPALAGLEKAGILGSHWEEVAPAEVGRPRRRLYRLTPHRIVDAQRVVADYAPMLAPGDLRKSPQPSFVPRGGFA